ncbi:hypothetical protein F11_11005 [Rhodospirillum rubrum F11]|uniref:Uncharacterized protein n=1 Tax=Rhodospirillum rubrum (strain ATCC 11170 / ATH 1.1.1 / DSM 467 / LMG 4362 / NCIMB 8255 / S1) TaxID=269796 RepID=Q2RSF8_RHORT|nr:N-acetylmuramidase [Rhodospirillum rubrum]ABC22937.1 Protein of unknown function DUF847 [Rhodospirillum rubrum ATCC 11170]AEO48665.1 hypothetical protein F11_11005 [Rhodospirillum rubrum F11]MBK5954558.1 hypothetical protein [Rhodospirillum rubrum]QXG78924.1 N-acetylmuramidase [Rhodospirillum rubrum]
MMSRLSSAPPPAAARVDALVADILAREGGYGADPADRGGATNHGISLRYAQGIGLDLDGDGDTDKDDIVLVTRDRAAALYRRDFFYGPRLHALPCSLWPVLFDWAVHSGPARAVIGLQSVLNQTRRAGVAGFDSLDEDGRIGARTRKAAEIAEAALGGFLVNALVEERLALLRRLVANDPRLRGFLKGWIARVLTFRVEV